MRQLLYQIIYHPVINPVLLRINKLLSRIIEFRLPPSGIVKVHVNGTSLKLATNQTSYVTKLLFWQEARAFEYTFLFTTLIKNCNLFFDIGANTGYYSILGSKVNSKLLTYAFEPSSGPLHFLTLNTEINNIQNQVIINPIALSNEVGVATFYEVRNEKYQNIEHNLSGVGSLKGGSLGTPVQVKTDTLDNFVLTHSIGKIDLIKLDTEGTENLILEGATNIIQNHLPIIICETLFNKIESELEGIMKGFGYQFFNHKNGKLDKVDTLIRSIDDGIRDCFFVHPTKLHLIKDFVD